MIEKPDNSIPKLPAPGTQRMRVLQAIIDLDEHSRPANKQAIAQMTGLPMSSIHDCVDALHDSAMISRVANGLWIPTDSTPDRAVSMTILPRGRTKIEAGDDMMTLSYREAFALAKMLAGLLMMMRSA